MFSLVSSPMQLP